MSVDITILKHRLSGDEDSVKIYQGHVGHDSVNELGYQDQWSMEVFPRGKELYEDILNLTIGLSRFSDEMDEIRKKYTSTKDLILYLHEEDIAYIDVYIERVTRKIIREIN